MYYCSLSVPSAEDWEMHPLKIQILFDFILFFPTGSFEGIIVPVRG